MKYCVHSYDTRANNDVRIWGYHLSKLFAHMFYKSLKKR